MEQVLWYAARRLAVLVAGVVLVVGAALVLGRRPAADAAVVSALVVGASVLTAVSLGVVAYAWRELRPPPPPKPVAAADVYRRSARGGAGEDEEPDYARAARASALAFVLLALAGTAAVVAAAMR
jgi:hypothetical protein